MNGVALARKRRWLPTANQWGIFTCLVAAALTFGYFIHPLLAVTARVDADVLVVEGWVDDAVLAQAAQEFHQGHYASLFTSGLAFPADENGTGGGSIALQAAEKLTQLGLPREAVIACPTPFVHWQRTASSARAVKDALSQRHLHPKGINVVTAGAHGRETWVAYRHIFKESVPVGIISMPTPAYDGSHWWTTAEGCRWVLKNIVGWPKEVLLGPRS